MNAGFSWDFVRKKPRRRRRRRHEPRMCIDRAISTDYNGKLSGSRDAFFFRDRFRASSNGRDREYESNGGVRGKKNARGLFSRRSASRAPAPTLRNSWEIYKTRQVNEGGVSGREGKYSFVQGQCTGLFARSLAQTRVD